MAQPVHIFCLTETFTAADVFRLLNHVCEHPNQRNYEPQFEFDWVKRRIAISANSEEGARVCHEQFTAQLTKHVNASESFLAGKVEEKDGRWIQPYGVALMDAATYAELIGQSLVDMGLRGVQIVDSDAGVLINVRQSAMAKAMDFTSFVKEFPLPEYVQLKDLGVQQIQPAKPERKKKRK